MKEIFINGIGVISRCAQSVEELNEICCGKEIRIEKGKIDFSTTIASSKLRRCSRYNKMAVAVAEQARVDGKISDDIDKLQVGTIISTGYGAVESNIEFSDSVVKKDPLLCSPTVFSGTVPNSCVGQICIINKYKGVSTVLMGGDPFEYSSLLLNNKKAEVIMCGSIEEYSAELESSFKTIEAGSDFEISEGAAILALVSEKNSNNYCKMTAFASVALSHYPYIHKVSRDETMVELLQVVKSVCGERIPDVIFTSENGTYFDEIERKSLNSIFDNKTVYATPKKIFGETLGCAYALSTAFAAVCLRTGKVPASVTDGRFYEGIKSILVTGVDTVGNYSCLFLER